MATENTSVESQESLAGKYLTFVLAEEEYGLEILKVREIFGMMDITAVPRTPDFIKGVINLRGKVIPIMDLRLKFGMPEAEHTDETCIIVVQVDGLDMGIVVDRVSEVLDIAGEDIDPSPDFGGSVDTDFILGMGKSNGRVTILLDVSRVVTRGDVAGLAEAVEANAEAAEAV